MSNKETRALRSSAIKKAIEGDGKIYVLRNRSGSTIILPKPSLDPVPRTRIESGSTFLGDSYHIAQVASMVEIVRLAGEAPVAQIEPDKTETIEWFNPETKRVEIKLKSEVFSSKDVEPAVAIDVISETPPPTEADEDKKPSPKKEEDKKPSPKPSPKKEEDKKPSPKPSPKKEEDKKPSPKPSPKKEEDKKPDVAKESKPDVKKSALDILDVVEDK
jgi:outer membrane biosynthesis protein TonB